MVKGVTQKIDEQEMYLRNKKIKKNNKIINKEFKL